MDNTWMMITNRMTQLGNQHKRMDDSRKLAYMETYQPVDAEGNPLVGVIPVTGNRAAVVAHTVIQDLLNAKWQCMVEGDITGNQAHKIEEFIEANLDQADEYLLEKYGLPGLYDWVCNHVCIRGPIGAEWCPWIEGDKYNIHCLPLDMRWVAYHPYMKWIAPITFRTSEELEEEFPQCKAIKGKRVDIEVRDYWDNEKNEIWIDSKLIDTRPNLFGKPPFVIVFPPAGFMLRDKGYLEHEAEDIFFLIKKLNNEVNRTLSIEQSLIFNVLRPPYEREVEVQTAEPSPPVPISGEVLDVKKGERHIPVPTGDFNRANLSSKQDLQKMMDEGAPIAPRVYTQPPSGAELVAEMEALQRLQNSRIIALKVFKEQLARLMIDQYITLAKAYPSLNIGSRGKRRVFSTSILRDPDTYSISYRGMTKNKRQELANLAMFAAAYDRLPLKYNLANVLMAEDPDGIIRDLEIEQAKKADPAIGLYEMARNYAERAAEIEDEAEADAMKIKSMMLVERAVAIVRQRQMPAQMPQEAQVPEVKKPSGDGQNLLPALIGGKMA